MKKNYLLFAVLLVIGITPVLYKTLVLDLDFIPKSYPNVWELEYHLQNTKPVEDNSKKDQRFFPVFFDDEHVNIIEEDFSPPESRVFRMKKSGGHYIAWTPQDDNDELIIKLKFSTKDSTYKLKNYKRKLTGTSLQRYLSLDHLTADEREALSELTANIVQHNGTLKKIKDIYYYISEEVTNTVRKKTIEETLIEAKGNSLSKARVFTALLRMQGVPARTVGGLVLKPLKKKKDTRNDKARSKIFYWNEFYYKGQWIPVSTNYDRFAQLPSEFIKLYNGPDKLIDIARANDLKVKLYFRSSAHKEFNRIEYKRSLEKTESLFIRYSLYFLPLPYQFILQLLLLMPVGTIILALCRNIIGFKSFGIFTPVILGLFFFTSNLTSGLIFFALIILTGIAGRYLLHRLYLLAVPRLSVILILLLIFIIIFLMLNSEFRLLRGFSPGIFPIVIATVLIERFGIKLEEEGPANTFIALSGTVAIALLCFVVFKINSLQQILFTYPELLFTMIGIQILIGQYHGFRLSELFRFKELGEDQGQSA